MAAIINIIWWACFIVVALGIQYFLPGLDALVAGLLVSLQERRVWQTLCLYTIFCLIQEGLGSLAFGYAPLWYGTVFLLFFLGRWLFVVENLLFIFLISICLGVAHGVYIYLLASLQNYTVAPPRLIAEGAAQALLIPLLWWVLFWLRKQRTRHVY